MAEIRLIDLHKTYPNGLRAVKGLGLHIRDREFMVLVGPSGCGKTTTLRMIAGLEDVSGGEIRIGARRVNEVEPKDRDIAMVFQNYALYPHMTVYRNMAYGLILRGVPKARVDEQVRAAAALLGLGEELERRPAQLSGGQRQRVALGRAIVRQPQVFLFDEPLSNLDAKLRADMRFELRTLQQRLQTTVVYVTHDQIEAMTLGDRITVMSAGAIQQVAPPGVIYDHPYNRFVAGFIGSPMMNFLTGACVAAGAGWTFRPDGGEPLGLGMPEQGRLRDLSGCPAVLGVRPEHLANTTYAPPAPGATVVPMQVKLAEQMGDHQCVHLRAPGDAALVMKCDAHHRVQPGEQVAIAIDTRRAHVFAGPGEFAVNITLPLGFPQQQ